MITSRFLEKLLQIAREHGVLKPFHPVIRRIPRAILERYDHIWLLRHLNAEQIEIEPKIPLALTFTRSDFYETVDWIKRHNLLYALDEKEIKVAISEGHYWVNAKYDGEIVGFIKIGFGKVFVSDYKKILQFPPPIAFLNYFHVVPEFRGKQIGSYLLNKACEFCKEQGYTKALGYVHDWNIASRTSLSNAGFREIKTIYFYKIWGIKFLTANPADL